MLDFTDSGFFFMLLNFCFVCVLGGGGGGGGGVGEGDIC